MKTLSVLQVLAKIGRVLSRIVFICCAIGVAGCAVGLLSLPFADTGIIKLGGVSIYGLICNHAGIELNELYALLAGAMIVCLGELITARYAEAYFRNECAAGTPFTLYGAKELLRLGILVVCVPLGAQIVALIVSGFLSELLGCGEAFRLSRGDSVALGVMLILGSLLCRCGAEQYAAAAPSDTEVPHGDE